MTTHIAASQLPERQLNATSTVIPNKQNKLLIINYLEKSYTGPLWNEEVPMCMECVLHLVCLVEKFLLLL